MSGQHRHDHPAVAPPPLPTPPAPMPGDALARFFLRRLAGLIARQDACTTALPRTALARAAFSTFLDCRDLGLEAAALALLRRESAPAAVRPGR